ncbi:MAG: class I tRNA ligase family protein, partial [Gordonibacter urolithinfaciens]
AKSGADVLRLWVASVDYSQDVNIGDEILERTSEAYRRIRNTMRFLLGSLSDFDDLKHTVTDWNALEPVDQWAMVRLWHLLVDVERAYDEYKFHVVYRAVYDYIVGDLSAVYMDATKDRVYSEAPDSPRRRAAQTVLMNIVEVLVRVLAPVLSFTTDEVWEHYPEAIRSREGRPGNVQLAGWPEKSDFAPSLPDDADAERIAEDFGIILGVREIVTKALEDARGQKIVNKSQEADVTVTAPRSVLDHVERYDAAVFEELFIVASVSFVEGEELSAEVRKTTAEKCPRCWNYRALGGNPSHPDVCERCGDVLDAIGYEEAGSDA